MFTPQKKRYAEARASGLSIKLAAIECGCPEKTAAQAGSRYEKDPDVIAAMKRLKIGEALKAEEPKPKPIKEPKPKREPKPKPEPRPETALEKVMRDEPEVPAVRLGYDDPLDFLRDMVNDITQDEKLRIDAAKAWDAGIRGRAAGKGKKDEAEERAKKAANKFAVAKAPLKAVK